MKISKRSKYALIALLIILNIIFRFPITPHEIGWDSFAIHSLANSISSFGFAKWLIHPLSIFGLYPYSYASAVPFLLSGISQLTGIDMEWTIWLFCVLIGILSAFTAYIMAGAINDDDIFKYLVALVYSTSLGILYFTTWTVSTRGLFIVLLPLFIYLLLRCHTSMQKYSTLTLVLFVILMTTHHLFYFIAPVVMSYFIVIIFNRLKGSIRFAKVSENFISLVLLAFFPLMFLIPFFTRTFIEVGSRYIWLNEIFLSYARFIGILIIFAVGGFIYLLSKHKKSFEEWFLLLTLLFLTPLLYVGTYMKWVFLIFAFILIGIGLSNVAKMYEQKKKCIFSVIVAVLLLSACVSAFYQIKYYTIDEPWYNERYMEDSTYTTALWVKGYTNGTVTATDYVMNRRIYAISEVPTFVGSEINALIYDYVNLSEQEFEVRPINSEDFAFFFDSPYIRVKPARFTDQSWYWHALQLFDCNSICLLYTSPSPRD